MNDGWSFETRQIHAGQTPDPATGARALPIYQTTSFVFRDAQHAADLFALKELGNIYTRIMNPTQDAVEQRLASLEGGVAALLVASGQAAETIAILNVAEVGDHIVSSPSLYGGTYNLFHYTLPKLGIEVSFVENPDDLDSWRAAVRPNTKAFFGETISNPKQDVLDIEGVATVAHEVGVPLIVDNTVATPYLVRPFEWGADVIVHSTTKYLGGHGTSIGGAIIDAGTFDYAQHAERYPNFNQPDPSYHGLVYARDLGVGSAFGANLSFILKARVQLLRDLGAATTPFNAFLLAQGLETLSLRVERHVQNAYAVARWLQGRDEVESVAYAGLPESPWYEAAQKYAPRGPGAVLAFEIKGGSDAGRRFVDALELHSHVANIGDVRSLVIHPASTTHSQLSAQEQAASGSHPAWSGCRWAWSTSTTSSPTSRRGSPRRRSSEPRLRRPRRPPAPPRPPSRGAWRPGDPPGRRRFEDVGTLALEAGGSLPAVRMAYETWGRPSAAGDNAVLVLHALTGDSHVVGAAEPGHPTAGWWNGLIGPGLALDTDRWFVVAPNVLGGCQGTTGPASPAADGTPWGSRFPFVTVRDQVAAEARLAAALGVERWALVVGGSMGGMRALEWAVTLPDRVERLLVLAATPCATGDQIAWCAPQLAAVRADSGYRGGDYYDAPAGTGPHLGLGVARRIAHATYRSQQELDVRFGRSAQPGEQPLNGTGRYAVESYLDHQAEKLVHRFDANSYVVLTEAMNSHDIGRGRGGAEVALSRVTARTAVAAIDSDRLYPVALNRQIADGIPGALPLRVISSPYGHDGFLIETGAVAHLVAELLADPTS